MREYAVRALLVFNENIEYSFNERNCIMQLSFTTVFATIIAFAGVTSAAPSGEITNSTLTPLAAPFGINYGQTQNNDVAWVDGQSKCNFVVIGPNGPNPCGRPFSINGESGFTFEGCGGSLWIDLNGQFFASCGNLKEADADEAQHRHYNDGYSPYPATTTPNPYDQYDAQSNPYDRPQQQQQGGGYGAGTPLADPFNPVSHNPYASPPPGPPPSTMYPPPPPPPADLGYGAYRAPSIVHPASPPHHAMSPAPSLNPLLAPPGPSRTPGLQPQYNRSAYDMNTPDDDMMMDTGDMPLLRRDPSSSLSMLGGAQQFPGGFEEDGEGMMVGDDRSENNIRYGRIPQRVPRRYKTVKKVELFHGNFVLDNAVPKKLLDMCANRTEREFTHMRYSAATCDPNNFKDSGFTLRQVHYDPPRRTELFIVMTMYNEDEELFCRTMHGVIKNVAHLCKRDRSKTWGKDGWKKVVVCIVSDGRGKINARTLSVIAAMGAYQEGVAKTKIGKQDVTAHIYEYTTQISVTPSLKIEGAEKGTVPVQVIFCLKEKNQKKINSHRWFFNAFGALLQPNVCVLLDVGTMPGPTSIYHLWKAFDINSNVGGACGEIVALKGKYGRNLINPLVAAQNFEYKMSNILDKP
ncbi:hypothetical protein CVT25_015462, partial [Psilocybe cyanescens]